MTPHKPWDPRMWPSTYYLIALTPLTVLSQQVVSLKWSLSLFVILILTIAIKLRAIITDRIETFGIFEKGKVPSVEWKSPLSGNLFEVLAPRENIQTIHRLHYRLGKTFGMFYGPDPWIFTTDLDLLQKIFVTEGIKHVDRNQFRLPFIEEINVSLLGLNGESWRSARRQLEPSFTRRQMHSDNVFRDIELAIESFLNCIAGHPNERADDGSNYRLVDVCYNFKKYTGDVIFRVAYGRENAINMEPLGRDQLIDSIDEGSVHIRGPVTWASIILDGAQVALGVLVNLTPIGGYINYIHSVLDDSLRRRRHLAISSGNLGSHRKMIDTIIESGANGRMSDDKLKANLFFIFVAGFETSANTLTIMFWLLALHQQVQDKLRKALALDGSQAQYLDWCMRETLRLYPAVPTAVGRILPETLHWKGQTLFAGTTLNASIYSIHHSAEYWGADVEEFRPERFADTSSFHPVQEFAFGHGPRFCLGAKLAHAEIKALVPRLLLRYRVEPGPKTAEKLYCTSPNLIHMIIHGQVELKFVELSSL